MSSQSRSGTRSGSHVAALDGVRGLAILMVMAVHFVGDQVPESRFEALLWKGASYGVWGVDLFFVLSGYLITGILLDSKPRQRFFRNFYVRRTLRIFPIYYAVLAVLFIVLPVVPALYPATLAESARHQAWVWSYATNLYLASKDRWALPYVSHFWSLAVEEQFYLGWPLVVFVCSRATLLRVCQGAIAVALVLRTLLSFAGAGRVVHEVLLPCRLDALCLGAYIAIVSRQDGPGVLARWSRPALYASSLVVLALSVLHSFAPSLAVVTLPLRGTVIEVFFGALLVQSLGVDRATFFGRVFTSAGMRFFGKYSYGLYLFHGIIGYAMVERGTQDWMTARLGSHLLAMIAFAVFGTVVSVLVAVLSYELFEKHFLRLKDRLAPSRH